MAAYSRQSDRPGTQEPGGAESDSIELMEPYLPRPGETEESIFSLDTDSANGVTTATETLITDSVAADSTGSGELTLVERDNDRKTITRIDRNKVDIESTVSFSAKDSMVLHGLNNAFLYGNGTVEYQDFKLNSAEIRMEMDSSTVYAAGVTDTAES